MRTTLIVGLILVLLGVGLFVAVQEGWLSFPPIDDGGPIFPPSPVLVPVVSENIRDDYTSDSGAIVTCYSDIDSTQSVTTIGNNPTTAPHLSLRPTISYTFFVSITKGAVYSNMTKVIMMPSDLNTHYEVYVEFFYFDGGIYPPRPPVLYFTKLELRTW